MIKKFLNKMNKEDKALLILAIVTVLLGCILSKLFWDLLILINKYIN